MGPTVNGSLPCKSVSVRNSCHVGVHNNNREANAENMIFTCGDTGYQLIKNHVSMSAQFVFDL